MRESKSIARKAATAIVLSFLVAVHCGKNADASSGSVDHAGLFNSIEFRGIPLRPWRGFVEGLAEANAAFHLCAATSIECPNTGMRNIVAELAKLTNEPPIVKVVEINRLANRMPYRDGWENYSKIDHWATPLEFLSRSGNCKDYAIFKYFLLRRLGFETDQLRVVFGREGTMGQGHAILLAFVDGEWRVLDNTRNAVVNSAEVPFEPIYSFNEIEAVGHLVNPVATRRPARNS